MDPRDIIAIVAGLGSISVSLWTLSKARTAIAVEKAINERRVGELEGAVTTLKAELTGVKVGFEIGIGKVQDSLQGVVEMLNKLQTTVAVLVDRDERDRAAPPTPPTSPARRRPPKAGQ